MTQPADEPPTLHYQGQNRPPLPAPPRQFFRFFLGILYGAAVSAVFWFGLFGDRFGSPAWGYVPLYAFLVVKFGPAFGLLLVRGWRVASAGIFLSILIGAFLFFAACATNFKV